MARSTDAAFQERMRAKARQWRAAHLASMKTKALERKARAQARKVRTRERARLWRLAHPKSTGGKKGNPRLDLHGLRVGKLLVVERAPDRGGRTRWLCQCDCGKTVSVETISLRARKSQSCGCRIRELLAARNTTHGLSKTPEYRPASQGRYKDIVRRAKEVPCRDCGVSYPYYVMDLDHVRGDKLFPLSYRGAGEQRLLAEIAKCDVVCANCHRARTYQRDLREFSPLSVHNPFAIAPLVIR